MAKRAIGIDFNSDYVRIVQIAKDKDGFYQDKAITAPLRRRSDDPVEFFKTLAKEHGLNPKTPIALSLLPTSLCYRHIEQYKTEQRSEQTRADWLDDFPFSAETIVTDGCAYNHLADQQQTYLMAATDRASIARQCEPLRQTGWNIHLIDTPALAVHNLALLNYSAQTDKPALLLFEYNNHLDILIFHAAEIIAIRSMPLPAGTTKSPSEQQANWLIRELEMTWRMAFNEIIPSATPLIAAGPIANNSALLNLLNENLLLDTFQLNPADCITIKSECDTKGDYILAQALALRCLSDDSGSTLNFQNIIVNDEKQQPQRLRQPALVTMFLITAIVLTIFATFYAKRLVLENHYNNLKTQIRNQFLAVRPDETNIVNENAQLQTHLASLQQQYNQLGNAVATGQTPLDIMTQINRQADGINDLVINRIQINPEHILIDAHCENTKQLDTWQQRLKDTDLFDKINRQSVTPDKTGGTISFILQITLAEEQL